MALSLAGISDTPVVVLVAKNQILNSVSETIPQDSEVLPLLTHLDVGKLTSTPLVRDKSDIQYSLRDPRLTSICQRKHNGINDHILALRLLRPVQMRPYKLHMSTPIV